MDQLRLFVIVIQQDLLLLVYVALGAILANLIPATAIAYAAAWRAGSRTSLLAPLLLAWGVTASISGMTFLLGWAVARQFFQVLDALPGLIPWQFWPLLAVVSFVVGVVFAWRRAASFLQAQQSRDAAATDTATRLQPARITLGSFFVYQLMGLLIIGLWVGSRREEIADRYQQVGKHRWVSSLSRFRQMGWDAQPSGQFPNHELHLRIHRGGLGSARFVESSLDLVRPEDHLIRLLLSSDHLTDTGMRQIAAQKRLEILTLGSAEVTDVGIAELRAATKLRQIHLICPQLTDKGLEVLSQLPNLESLSTENSQITPAAEERFRKEHPKIFLAVGRPLPQ